MELEQAVPWLIDRAKGLDTKKALDEARTRLADEQQRKIELEVRRLRRDLVEVDRVELVWGRILSAFRSRILAIPSKLAGQLIGLNDAAIIRDKIEAEATQALAELSDEGAFNLGPATQGPARGTRGGEAATEADGEPMGGPESSAVP